MTLVTSLLIKNLIPAIFLFSRNDTFWDNTNVSVNHLLFVQTLQTFSREIRQVIAALHQRRQVFSSLDENFSLSSIPPREKQFSRKFNFSSWSPFFFFEGNNKSINDGRLQWLYLIEEKTNIGTISLTVIIDCYIHTTIM